MEFWGVEVKSGEPLFVQPGEGMILHLSQACLGELKKEKGSETICLFVKVDEKKLVLGNLFSDRLPQQQFDLVFDKDFELSHNWKNGNVYFYGYRANNPFDESDDEDEFGSEEDIPVLASNNLLDGKPTIQAKQEKSAVAEKPNAVKDIAGGKQKVKIVEPNKDVKPDEDDKSDESDDISPEEDDESDSESEEEDESDEDEETPKKVETGKKRAAESATKTPGPDKKAKTVTPKKTDGKKDGGHVATPHPAKQGGKIPANRSNQQTPKSGGSHTCKSCNRTFNSENALDSHTKAKHSGGK